jgi:predicted transposase YbfD/YdcC
MSVKAALSSHKKRSLVWENEITAAAALLHPFLVKGRISSADAMHTQKKWCAGVDASDG